ncbi:MAG TPA: VOC family protein [Acidobacteriaceae bacterium]
MSEFSPSLAAAKLSPFLHVRRSKEAVAFYKTAFGARELFRFDAEDGSVVAQLGIGLSDFWVSEESIEFRNFSPETLGGGTMHMVIVVDDPHAVYDKAIAEGATVECPVRDEEYGWRIGKLRDPFGHAWEIGKLLK